VSGGCHSAESGPLGGTMAKKAKKAKKAAKKTAKKK
jgi:hypothetical protein